MFIGSLREYQQDAVDRMVERGQMLLAMTMGAGKTPTTLGAIEQMYEDGDIDRVMIVVPASLKLQWRDEIKKFTNGRTMVIDGTKKKRERQWRTSGDARYVIVNPETLLNDYKLIGQIQAIVIDESTIIKNRSAKRSKLMKRLGKTVPFRFALTGQPIENRPEELFSIMEFVDKDVLGSFEQFDRTFIVRDHWGKPSRYRNLDKMHKTMKECMVRKTREDIADQLPNIIHQVIPVPFDTKGAGVYRRIQSDLVDTLSKALRKGGSGFSLWDHYNNDGDGGKEQGEVMTRLTTLRMLCDNPALVRWSSGEYANPDTKHGSEYANTIVNAGIMAGVFAAPKLDAVVDYITEVLAESPDNKVVLFSFFKENLRLIQEATRKITNSVLFMGGMTADEKQDNKNKFQSDPNTRLFLSSDAGGYGVDLPQANYLISYDLPWSSGKLEQREARIIRLSSQWPHVTIATFVMAGSIEERQYQMLQEKLKTNEAFIDGKHHDMEQSFSLTMDNLSTFMKESMV